MKKTLLWAILALLFLPVTGFCSTLTDASIYGRHILLVHDVSSYVEKTPTSHDRAISYLDKLLFDGLSSVQAIDSITGPDTAEKPLWRSGDALTVITFGMNSDSMLNMTHATPANWIHEFNNKLFDPLGTVTETNPIKARKQLADMLNDITVGPYYSPSRYLFPFVLSRNPKNIFAAETILITIRDYHTSTQRDGIVLREMCGDACADAVTAAQSKLLDTFADDMRTEIRVENDVLIEIRRITSKMQTKLTTQNQRLSLSFDDKNIYNDGKHIQVNWPNKNKTLRVVGLGLEVELADGRTSLWPGSNCIDGINSTTAPLAPFHLSRTTKETPIDQARLYAKTISTSGDLHLGQIKWFIPFQLELRQRADSMTILLNVSVVILILAIGAIWFLFRRNRQVDVLLPQGPDTIRLKGLDCHLFECAPGNPNTRFKLKILLNKRPARLNFSSKTKTIITVETDHGDFPETWTGFDGSIGQELRLTKLPRSSNEYELTLSSGDINAEDLCTASKSHDKDPFSINLRIKTGAEEQTLAFHGLFIRPEANIWIGLDPGTTGSCAYVGANHFDLKSIQLSGEEGAESTPKQIMDSAIYFTDQYSGPSPWPFDPKTTVCGQRNIRQDLKEKGTLVTSAKRLVGYENKLKIKDAEGEIFELRGEDAQAVLVDCIVSNALSQLGISEINKAVVAVPNSFTPAKIEMMKECCRRARGIESVEHIYEVEAVLLYFYKHCKEGEIILPTTALVIDFGGSTLNLAVATLSKKGKDLHVEMHARLGYNIGGDTLTAMVAHAIWENPAHRKTFLDKINTPDLVIPSPFDPKASIEDEDIKQWELTSDLLWTVAEEVKKTEDSKYPGVFSSPEITGLLKTIDEGIQEVLEIAKKESMNSINLVIPTGRSTHFPKVDEVIKETIKRLAEESDYTPRIPDVFKDSDQRKTCVAEGAAYYGVLKDTIFITRAKTFAHYGFMLCTNQRDWEFVKVINMGKVFTGDSVHGELNNIDVRYNNNKISFYQILAADPEKALRENRASLMCDLQLPSSETELKKVTMTLYNTDTFDIQLDMGSQILPSPNGNRYTVEDITTEMDTFTTWRLV